MADAAVATSGAAIGPPVIEGTGAAGFHRAIFVGAGRLLLVAPFLLYPVFLMKVAVLRAVCVRLQPAARLWRPAVVRARGLFRHGELLSAYSAKVWGLPPELAILAGTAMGAALGLLFGALAIRRQGIYFAMITLALAQMVYFFSLQAKFTGGEDGIQAVPRGTLFGLLDLAHRHQRSTTSSRRSSWSASTPSTASSIRRSARS